MKLRDAIFLTKLNLGILTYFFYRKEILEYPHSLAGLQLHDLKRFSLSLKNTWLKRIVVTDSGWTTFTLAYEKDKCWLYGSNFLEKKKNSITNLFWKEVAQSMYDLRMLMRPVTDYDNLSRKPCRKSSRN